jgi:hypothetical protein
LLTFSCIGKILACLVDARFLLRLARLFYGFFPFGSPDLRLIFSTYLALVESAIKGLFLPRAATGGRPYITLLNTSIIALLAL